MGTVISLVLVLVIPILLAQLVIGAVVLRAAVAWRNRWTGNSAVAARQPNRAPAEDYAPNVGSHPENDNPYASPAEYGTNPTQKGIDGGVPEPSIIKGMGIACASWLAVIVFGWIWSSMAQRLVEDSIDGNTVEGLVAIHSAGIPIGFCIFAAMLKGLLPTRHFGTACVIALLEWVIAFLIILALGGIFLGMHYIGQA